MTRLTMFCLLAALSGPCRAAEGILIEMEKPERRQSNEKGFGEVFKDPAAFGGAVLTRFFLPGNVEYKFVVAERGEYSIWLRYAAKQNQKVAFAVDAPESAGRGKSETVPLPATGELVGPSAWRWTKLGSKALAEGEHRLVVHSAAIRPDCIWLGILGGPPEAPSARDAERIGETRKHMERPIEPIAPAWLAEAEGYALPAWYDAIRVCAHTRLSWPWRTKNPDAFQHAGVMLASVGFKEVARHMRSGSEAAWWPSAVGDVQPEARERNFAKEVIDEAHGAGCRIILYHRHMEDDWYAKVHPECRVLNASGEPVGKRGPKVCLNTPFADFVQVRLLELAKMGADGFYFDEVHMEKPVCWCTACREGFKRETGLDYPAGADPYDPAFQKAIEYKNVVMERVFRKWRAAIHGVNPECVMLVGSNTYPAMNDRHFTNRLSRITDSMKSEFNLAARAGNNRIFAVGGPFAMPETDVRIALGYSICRDSCDGRPPHVWAHGLGDPVSTRFAAAGMIANGMVANLDVSEGRLPEKELFADAVSLGNRVSPAFAGMRPLRWGLVHFSEWARDYYLPDEAEAWRKVLFPTYGAFAAMLRSHLPVGIITDSQLEQGRLDGCGALFLPAPDRLSEGMRRSVEAFRERGGVVVEQREAWRWHEPGSTAAAGRDFISALGAAIGHAPVVAAGGETKMQMVAFSGGGRLTVALVNDFSWVQTGVGAVKRPAKGAGTKAGVRKSAEGEDEPTIGDKGGVPPACRGVVVTLRAAKRPGRVTELVTGKALSVAGAAGDWRVAVPDFDCMAVLVVEPGAG
ncbi:MAG TPA: hypothetical protein PLU30_06005 [Verrucomicrobiae bacterium]|nr:hypothetical protein [Verrucomicrobiae bacterium]